VEFQNVDGETVFPKSKLNFPSNSTGSPSHNDKKKTKFFVSPNRFASLPIDNNSNKEVFPVSCDNSSTGRAVHNFTLNQPYAKLATTFPPQIQVKNLSDITLFKNSLSSRIDINR
jgi:hypothetical protein